MGEKVLIENKDYTVDVTKQINVGSYKLTVIGKGGYNGKLENVDWKIEPMQLLSFCHVDSLTKTYDGTAAATLTKSAVKFYSRTSSFITLPEDAYDITNARFTKLQADKSYQDGTIAYHRRTGGHGFTAADWSYFLDFTDKIFCE